MKAPVSHELDQCCAHDVQGVAGVEPGVRVCRRCVLRVGVTYAGDTTPGLAGCALVPFRIPDGPPLACTCWPQQRCVPETCPCVQRGYASPGGGTSGAPLLRTECPSQGTCTCRCVVEAGSTGDDGDTSGAATTMGREAGLVTLPPLCGSRRVQRTEHLAPGLCVRPTAYGVGVFAGQNVDRDAFVGVYKGPLVRSRDVPRVRQAYAEAGVRGNYLLTVREWLPGGRCITTTIDPTMCGGVTRYMNHSCDPNVRAVICKVDNIIPIVAFFTLRTVAAGEQLSWSYGQVEVERRVEGTPEQPPPPHALDDDDDRPLRVACHCGAVTCQRWLPFDPRL